MDSSCCAGTSPIDDCGDKPIGYQLELVARPNTKHWLGKVAVLCELEMATEFPNAVCVRPFPCFFLRWRVRISVIRTAKNPKIGQLRAKIRASVY